MGLRNCESEPLCDGRQNSGRGYWDRWIFIDGSIGLQASLSAAIGASAVRLRIFALPRAYRKRHSWSVVHLLRDLIGDDLAADIARARYRTDAMASSPVCSFGMN